MENTRKITELLRIMARLRDPEHGCPWDRAQNLHSIVPHTLEEAYEVADSIESQRLDELPGELGDLLFQVVFYCQLAAEQGLFDFDTVTQGIVDKLVRRHPHVFGTAHVESAQDQSHAWEGHKAAERGAKARLEGRPESLLDGVALALPALTRAVKLQRRAARGGFDWPTIEPVYAKVTEELAEARVEIDSAGGSERIEAEVGDLLLACTNLARHAGVDPETALRRANARFERRFRQVEAMATQDGRSMSEASAVELEALWVRVKSQE